VASLCALSSGCGSEPLYDEPRTKDREEPLEPYRALARHWSPRIYQDTDDSFPLGDYITNFNFDGDYNGRNNWENLANKSSVNAYVYYAVSETLTHYFIHYSLFHPRDWHEWLSAEMHENDLEGVSLAVEKTGGYGTLIAMVTMAHDEFYQYAASPDVHPGHESIDGSVRLMAGSHPAIFVEAKGHGIHGCDARCDNAPGGDGIVYAENERAEAPQRADGNFTQSYGYALIAMDASGQRDENQGLWHRRYDICDTCTFGAWGKLRGDDYGINRANAPWAWDDPDDGQVFAGSLLCDPAQLFHAYFEGVAFDSDYSDEYVSHGYASHWFQVSSVLSHANLDAYDGRSDLYVRVAAPGSPAGSDDLFNAAIWQQAEAEPGVWYSLAHGGATSTPGHGLNAAAGSRFFCREGGGETRFEVYDKDTDPDDLMGARALSDSADFTSGLTLEFAQLRFAFGVR